MKGVISMSGRKIYSNELKLEIVQRYLKGDISLKDLAEKYHVGKSDIQKWKAAYIEHGIAGLTTTHGTYTGDFKVAVVEYMHTTGASMRQTAAHFNIPSMKSVNDWERIYYEEGKEALYEERRGRAHKMGTKKPRKPKNDVQTNEDLLAEVQRLRMENEYLKKLNALVQEREKSGKKTK
jgi:transposase